MKNFKMTTAFSKKKEEKFMKIENRHSAFTLAETLVTVVILGIVAAIVVPNLINRQVENANRTKVRKAMASYEKAINFIILENDIKSTDELKAFGEDDNCASAKAYFKTIQDGTNDCIFKTADRVWWNITDLTNPLISLKDEITSSNEATIATNALSLSADKTSFGLIGRFDDIGTLRVNDNAYEQGLDNNAENKKYMTKLWYFTGNLQLTGFAKCSAEGKTICTIKNTDGQDVRYTKIITTNDTTSSHWCNYDRTTKDRKCYGHTSIAPAGEYWISDNLGGPTEAEAKDLTGSVCTSQECIDYGDYYEASKRKCAKSGGRLPTLAELSIIVENGNVAFAKANGEQSGGWHWAAEENYTLWSYIMHDDGYMYYYEKWSKGANLMCVGNE